MIWQVGQIHKHQRRLEQHVCILCSNERRSCFRSPLWPAICLLLAAISLVGCSAAEPTYAALKATAALTGCWPGNAPTPPAVTVTPRVPLATVLPGTATSTPQPTTTPLPRCTPAPGAPTLVPYPTAMPTLVPHPTQPSDLTQGGSAPRALLHLPRLHHVDIAVHPAEGWPAVVSVWPDDVPSRRIFARVYRPDAHTWGPAQQVNPPTPPRAEEGNGLYGGLAIGITGDGAVHVAWGGAFTPGRPVWYARSTDYGTTWSPPKQIGAGCYHVEAMGTTLDNQVMVLAWCSAGGGSQARPGILQRGTDGVWRAQEELPIDGQHSTLVLVGDGAAARAVVLAVDVHHQGRAWIAQRPVAGDEAWRIQSIDLAPPAGMYRSSASFYLLRGAAFHRPNGEDAIVFTWSVYGGNAIHALTSLDGGHSWGPLETVAAFLPVAEDEDRPPDHRWSAPAYDARADRLVMLLVRRDLEVPWPGNGTHYAQWSIPGSGMWTPQQGPVMFEQAIPLISGARSASWTDSAQTSNGSFVWLAWVDRWQELWVRSVDLNLLVPPDQYPTTLPISGGS